MPKALVIAALVLPLLLLAVLEDAEPEPEPEPQLEQEPDPTAQAAERAGDKTPPPASAVTALDWNDLIPADWRPDRLMAEYDLNELRDDDPRAQELMEKLRALWKEAPVVQELDGRSVKLPGYVVPLEMHEELIAEFLLVPYFGACIHVPPPPANQIVHVVTGENAAYRGQLFDTVWVTGTLKVEALSSDLGDAGYRLQEAQVEPYP